MSIAPELLTFGVGVDTSAAEAGLASLGASGEQIASGLENNLSAASEGMVNLGKESSKTSRGIQGLAAVVSLVDPRLGQVIRSVGTLTRGLSVLRLGLGPAAVAVAAVTAALAYYKNQQEQAAEVERRSTAVTDIMRSAREKLRDSTLDLNTELGKMTRMEREIIAIRQQAFVESLPAVQEFTRQIVEQSHATELARAELKQERDDMAGVIIRYEQGSVMKENLAMLTDLHSGKVRDAALAYQEESGRLGELQTQYGEFLTTLRQTIDNRTEELRAKEANAAATRQEAKDKREAAKAERELAAAQNEVLSIERDATLSVLDDQAKLNYLYQERLDRLREIRAESESAIETAKAEAALRMQFERDLMALQDEEREKEQSAREQRQQAMIGIYSNIADAAIAAAEKRADGDERAAARAKATAKALGLTEIAIARAVGIQNAISRNAGRPAATALAVATQIAAAIQQTAAIAAAHQGARLAPDEVQDPRGFRRLVGERDNGPGQVLSPEASRRLERGESAVSPMVAVPVFQHFGLFFPDYIQGPGTPLNDELNSSRDTGRSVY